MPTKRTRDAKHDLRPTSWLFELLRELGRIQESVLDLKVLVVLLIDKLGHGEKALRFVALGPRKKGAPMPQDRADATCDNTEEFVFDITDPLTLDGKPATIDGVSEINVIPNDDGTTGGGTGQLNVDGIPSRFGFVSGTLEEDETEFQILIDVRKGPKVVNIEARGHLSVTPKQAATVKFSPLGVRPKA